MIYSRLLSGMMAFCILGAAMGYAEPSVTSVSGSPAHKNILTITGSGFGVKSPAAPLWWDDGEGAPVNNASIMMSGEMTWVASSLSGLQKNYNEAAPANVTQDGGRSNMQYRTVNHRSVGGPHGRSTRYLTGCHDDQGECLGGEVGQTVALNVSDGATHDVWFVMYYERLDPLWPLTPAQSTENYKMFNWEGSAPYTMYRNESMDNYDNSTACGGGYNGLRRTAGCGADWIVPHIIRIFNQATCGQDTRTDGYPVLTHSQSFKNPLKGWTKAERRLRWNSNFYQVLHDNIFGVDTTLDPEGNCALQMEGPFGGVTIGGFFRQNMCGGSQDDLNDDACRYFDDVYVDNTFSRVVLGNRDTYSTCTVVEPQIPSAWAGNSITVALNQGALPSCETAYLYVFDSNNDANARGYPVRVVTGLGEGPCPPRNLGLPQ